MRIGLFTDTYLPDINGVVSSTVTLKNALEKQGHTVYVITNHAGSKIEFDGDVLRLPGVPLKSLYGYKLSSPISIKAGTYIKNMNLDVIHLQTNFGIGIYGQNFAKNLGIPLVDTYHTMYEDYTHYINPKGWTGVDKVSKEAIRAASRQVCNHVQAVVSPSVKTKEILMDYGVIAPIYVVPTGLDLDAFFQASKNNEKSQMIRQSIGAGPDACVLVFVGRLAKEKSLEIPIEAFARLADDHFHLAIVGAGPDEDYYKNYAEMQNAKRWVHFTGKADPKDIPDFYRAFDGFVSASLSETQGMTYLEALAAGRMIFGRRDEVLDGLVDEGLTGYYFDDVEELCEKIRQFDALSSAQKKENEELCRQKTSDYTDTVFAGKMAAVYERAILDYSKTYIVEKIKILDDFVQLTLSRDSSRELETIIIPLEDYFEFKISMGTKLDSYHVDQYKSKQDLYNGLISCKKRLFARDMSAAQLMNFAKTRLDLDSATAQEIVEAFKSSHLIDDHAFAMDKSSYWQSQGYSKKQIDQKLAKAGISSEERIQALDALPFDKERENAAEVAKRLMSSVKAKSRAFKKQSITRKLISRGYSSDTAREAAEMLDYEEDDQAALHAAIQKAKRLYERKPEHEKKQKIIQYCQRQGFRFSEIEECLESEALND